MVCKNYLFALESDRYAANLAPLHSTTMGPNYFWGCFLILVNQQFLRQKMSLWRHEKLKIKAFGLSFCSRIWNLSTYQPTLLSRSLLKNKLTAKKIRSEMPRHNTAQQNDPWICNLFTVVCDLFSTSFHVTCCIQKSQPSSISSKIGKQIHEIFETLS